MSDYSRTKAELVDELVRARQKIAVLEHQKARPAPEPDLARLPPEAMAHVTQVPLVPRRGTGFAAVAGSNRWITVSAGAPAYQPDALGRFWLEAESATLLSAYPANGAADVAGACGKALYMVPVRPHAAAYGYLKISLEPARAFSLARRCSA